jgi:PAS domain-containing protein
VTSDAPSLKDLQNRLRIAEQRLHMAEIAGGIATFEHDFGTGEWTLSDRFWNLIDRVGSEPPTFEEVARSIFPDDLLKLQAAAEAARTAGTLQAEFRLRLGKDVRWIEARGRTIAAEGKPRLWGAFYEISQRKTLEARLLSLNETLEARIAELGDETRALSVLNSASTAISANLDLEAVLQAVTDAAVKLSGAAFGAFFYNLVSEKGESYTLDTLSGAPRSAFEKFPMPRNTAVFEPTFRGTGIVRSPDILADPRYGKSAPHFGMPKGHLPVRSYLAVPVTARAGEVLGGLFFGHPQPGMFTERAERLVTAIAGQAAVAIDNVRLYQALQRELEARRQAEQNLRNINETLEQRAGERSRELADTERRFRLLVEGVTDYAIYMLDATGNVVNWNPGAQLAGPQGRQPLLGERRDQRNS